MKTAVFASKLADGCVQCTQLSSTLTGRPLEILLLSRKVGLQLLIPVGLRLSLNLRHGYSIKEEEVYEAEIIINFKSLELQSHPCTNTLFLTLQAEF